MPDCAANDCMLTLQIRCYPWLTRSPAPADFIVGLRPYRDSCPAAHCLLAQI